MHRPSLFGRLRRPLARTTSVAAFAALFLVNGAVLGEVTTVELSPLVAKSTLVGPVDGTQEIGVTLALPSSDPKGLADFVRHISTPGDPLFRHYITPQQFAERFGGNAADYAYLKGWAAANGLRVSHESVGRINLTVRGTVSQFQRLFNTQLSNYRSSDGQEFYSASVNPRVPAEISSKISGVIGLTESTMLAPMIKVGKTLGENPAPASALLHTDTAGGTGPGGTYKAADLRTAYNIPTFGNLSPTAVAAVFEQGGYVESDIAKYLSYNKLPSVTVTPVSVDGSPTTAANADVELEAVLDVDMIVGINPAISGVRVYIDSLDPFATALLDAITQVGDDDLAQVFSVSYAADEGTQGQTALSAENTALAQLAAEGITVTASSGDDGCFGHLSLGRYNVEDPASQPYVTGVGGTTLYTGPGEVYLGESAWNDFDVDLGATGGGISAFWSIPDFQSTLPIGGTNWETGNGGSATYRNVPDVSADGDPLTGVGVYSKENGGWVQIGGTSVSSPIWAGYLSIINAGLSYGGAGNLGYFNPILYWVGTPVFGSGFPTVWLYEVPEGSNGTDYFPGFHNGDGYCNTTGNGSLAGSSFATQLLISGSQTGTAPGAISELIITNLTSKSVSFQWTPATGAGAYEVAVYGRAVSLSLTKATTLTVTGLAPNALYSVNVWAYNASGGSEYQGPYFQTAAKSNQ
jgi:subtilase family serine protease